MIIIEDTEGVFKKGDKITITANAISVFEENVKTVKSGIKRIITKKE